MVYAPNSLRVVFKASDRSTMIDSMTASHLELITNQRSAKSDHSLYGVLNYTKTAGGGRLLRSNILQPPNNQDTITLRLDCVEELTEKEEVFLNIQGLLSRFLDVDHLISMFVQIPKSESVKTAEMRIAAVIYLKHTLELVEPLRSALEQCANPLFRAYHKTLEDKRFTLLLERIQEVIHDSTHYQKGSLNMRTQKCFAIKPRINGLLDVARRTYTEIVDDIAGLITQLAEKYNLPLRTGYNATRSFFIQMPALPGLLSAASARSSTASVRTATATAMATSTGTATGAATARSTPSNRSETGGLPAEFIKVVRSKATISFTTNDLIKLNDRVRESLHEIYLMTNVALNELLTFVREHISCLYNLSECVSMADMLVSFSHACTLSDYVRPEFTNTLALKQARHPILDKISNEPPVPNNTYAADGCHFHIVTGPNMSGKSTYLKQIMLCQIMAQIGCFVPAQYASFRLCKQLFSRMGCRDDVETNASTFMLEMREAHYILQEASEGCLVIIDELGRGTSSEEGMGICHAICEELIAKKTFTFFATHFLELTQLEGLYPSAINYHMDVQHVTGPSGDDKIHYTHQLRQGKMQEKQYGIKIAEMSTLPTAITSSARQLHEKMQQYQVRSHNSRERSTKRAVHTLATCLLQAARNSRLNPESLQTYLQQLKVRYMKEVELQDAEE
ncbi:mutS protein homolog 4-like isoform X2 [Sycon ciliatum]